MKANRPRTFAQVADQSNSLEEFGYNLRDWQHEIQRGGVHSRSEFARRIADTPVRLVSRFSGGDTADAYLAAYAEWLADRAGIERPAWCSDGSRTSADPWFSAPSRSLLLVQSPASFRQRNLFTVPEPVFTPHPGRPPVDPEQKREKARLRQSAYRKRVRALLRQARAAQEAGASREVKELK